MFKCHGGAEGKEVAWVRDSKGVAPFTKALGPIRKWKDLIGSIPKFWRGFKLVWLGSQAK